MRKSRNVLTRTSTAGFAVERSMRVRGSGEALMVAFYFTFGI